MIVYVTPTIEVLSLKEIQIQRVQDDMSCWIELVIAN